MQKSGNTFKTVKKAFNVGSIFSILQQHSSMAITSIIRVEMTEFPSVTSVCYATKKNQNVTLCNIQVQMDF